MKDLRMSDRSWNISEEDIAKMFPELNPEERREAAENYSAYLRVVARVYDDLKDKGELNDVLLRLQYEKRNQNKPASQNDIEESDDIQTSSGESNQSTS